MLEKNKIYCGDHLEIMKEIDDDSIDLTVTSPPYDDLRIYEGYKFDYKTLAHELFRVTKEGGVVVWIVGDQTKNGSESGTSFKQALYFKDEIGFNLHDTMIYQKGGQGATGSNYAYWQDFEYMFVLSKGKLKTFNPIEDKKNIEKGEVCKSPGHRNKHGTKKSKRTYRLKEFGRRTNIWKIRTAYKVSTKDEIAHQHPAIFPDQLANDHIISWSNEGDLVLDPMCGSGTACKMARLNNRDYIGIDVSEEYCEITRKRLAAIPTNLKQFQ